MLRFSEGFCAIDTVLMNRVYIPLSRFAGRQWGSTACSLSRAWIAPMVVFGTIRMITAALTPPVSSAWAVAFALACTLFLATSFWIQAARADTTPNPFELESPSWRVFWIVLTIGFLPGAFGFGALHDVCAVIDAVACLSVIYFRAVPSPPPKKKRAPKGWLQPAQFGNAA